MRTKGREKNYVLSSMWSEAGRRCSVLWGLRSKPGRTGAGAAGSSGADAGNGLQPDCEQPAALLVIGVIVFLIVFLTPWACSPLLDSAITYSSSMLSNSTSASVSSIQGSLIGIVGTLDMGSSISSILSLVNSSSSSSASAYLGISGSSAGLLLYFVLWVATFMIMAAGAMKMFVDPSHDVKVMRVGLFSATILGLVWIILMAQINASVGQIVQSVMGSSSYSSLIKTVSQYGFDTTAIAATAWPILVTILSLVAGLLTFTRPMAHRNVSSYYAGNAR